MATIVVEDLLVILRHQRFKHKLHNRKQEVESNERCFNLTSTNMFIKKI